MFSISYECYVLRLLHGKEFFYDNTCIHEVFHVEQIVQVFANAHDRGTWMLFALHESIGGVLFLKFINFFSFENT